MKKKSFNRITAMTIIFSLILSLFSNLAFASNGTIFSENHKQDSPKIVSLMLSAYNTTYVEQGEKNQYN